MPKDYLRNYVYGAKGPNPNSTMFNDPLPHGFWHDDCCTCHAVLCWRDLPVAGDPKDGVPRCRSCADKELARIEAWHRAEARRKAVPRGALSLCDPNDIAGALSFADI